MGLQTFIEYIIDLPNICQGFFDYLQFFFKVTREGPGRKKFLWFTRIEKLEIIFVQLYLSIPNSKLCTVAEHICFGIGPAQSTMSRHDL